MKLVKSLLLGSAAGLVAVAGASAADLGVKKPSAVEYVKTCPTYGAGFFVVPGTTSCLKIIGRVRVDYIFNNDAGFLGRTNGAALGGIGRTKDKNTFRARGYLGFDHRTATEYGMLRTYVRAFIQRDNAVAHAVNLEYAFIQFGGLTVGRVTPVFEHNWDLTNFAGGGVTTGAIGGTSSIVYVNSIGYTANFGGGFSATLALDSAAERRVGTANNAGTAILAAGGQALPDIVAALAYDAAWGSVKLTGAVHQTRTGFVGAIESKLGYAGQLAAKVNLPFLATGSHVWLSGVVAEGASSYAGFGTGEVGVGQYNLKFSDAALNAAGALRLTKTWGVAGGFQAFVTPTVWVAMTGTYGVHDQFGANNTIKAASVAGAVGWQPVAGFLIGGEVVYRNIQLPAALTVAGAAKSDVTGRIRFQRDF